MSFERVVFTADARDDLRDLAKEDERLVVEALRVAKRVDEGTLDGKRLHAYSKTGDLSDCFRVYFGAEPNGDSHRIVFRNTENGVLVEVVAIATRERDIPYLLAGLRLGRIDDPVRRSDAQRIIARVRSRGNRFRRGS